MTNFEKNARDKFDIPVTISRKDTRDTKSNPWPFSDFKMSRVTFNVTGKKWSAAQRAKFWPKILILEVIYRSFELNIYPKVELLRPKIMPKQLLNISKTTFKKSKKRLFWPPKWSKWPLRGPNFDLKFWFWRSYIDLLSSEFTLKWGYLGQE